MTKNLHPGVLTTALHCSSIISFASWTSLTFSRSWWQIPGRYRIALLPRTRGVLNRSRRRFDPRRSPMQGQLAPWSRVRTRVACSVVALTCLALLPLSAKAQYVSTNLVSNTPGALQQDSNLVNGWGLALFPGSFLWVSNQNTSTSTLYKGDGTKVPLVVQIPCISMGTPTVPCPVPGLFPIAPPFGPSGIVANTFAGAGAFQVSQGGMSGPSFFIFDTLDGLV